MRCAVKCFYWFVVAAVITLFSGCATSDPQNASVRPWNAPQSWEGGLPVDMGQHR
jgi:hypothetical protein